MDAYHLAELAFSAFFRIGLQFPPSKNVYFFPKIFFFNYFSNMESNDLFHSFTDDDNGTGSVALSSSLRQHKQHHEPQR
jgi:hypothetical protein